MPASVPASVPAPFPTSLPVPTAPPPIGSRGGATSAGRTSREPADRFVLPHPTVTIRHWPDQVLDQFGHDPRSNYVERYWLPILGPSSTLLMRFLAARFDEEPDAFELNLREASRCIGVGINNTPGAPFFRTLERVISFGFGQLIDDRLLVMRSRMPSLTRRQVLRLPRKLQREHDDWVEAQRARPHPEELRRRARALALSLFELGEDYESTERQLHRWKFHPAIAHDAVQWAATEHLTRANGLRRAEAAAAGSEPLASDAVEHASASNL